MSSFEVQFAQARRLLSAEANITSAESVAGVLNAENWLKQQSPEVQAGRRPGKIQIFYLSHYQQL